MISIGGNMLGKIQVLKRGSAKNEIGEVQKEWADVIALKGFLDMSGNQTGIATYKGKVEQSSHIFLCDFSSLKSLSSGWLWDPFSFVDGIITDTDIGDEYDVTTENARMVIDGKIYDILLIDDPMRLHQHFEIYLKYVGGQDG